VALVGLILLAVIGWLATGLGHANQTRPHGTPATVSTQSG
jgi:hypothetical protein